MKQFIGLLLLLVASVAAAQSPSSFPYAYPVPNDPTTGTTQFTLTKVNSSGNAVIMATTDTSGYAGVCVDNCGKVGTAWVVFAGLAPLTMENTATAQHYVQIGSTTGGNGHDSGATTYPASCGGTDVIGRIQVGASAGNQAMVVLFPPEMVCGTVTIASGTAAMGTSAITSGTCATVVTVSATGVATTDAIVVTPNADPTGVTGYAVSATGSLYIQAYPTSNNVNFKVCNNTAGSLTPSALTLNWRVIR